jgi:hypothetical protein
MAEPTTTSGTGLVALSIAVLGPTFGEYGLIVFAALGGALWALGSRPSSEPILGIFFLLKILIAAIILTGALSGLLEHYTAFTAKQWLAPVAFAIGFFGDNWMTLGQSLMSGISRLIARKSEGA